MPRNISPGYLLAGLRLRFMVVEPRPPGPVAADGEAAEDEEDEDVLDLVGPRAHHETGLADQETQPDTDVNIPASSHRHELCPPSLPPSLSPLFPQTVLAGVAQHVDVADHPEAGQRDPDTALNRQLEIILEEGEKMFL